MPEGDTIERVAERLAPLVGEELEIVAPHPRHALHRLPERLAATTLVGVEARGKHLLLRFSNDLLLRSHLRLTGRWAVHRRGDRWPRSAARAWLVLRTPTHEAVLFDGPEMELLTPAQASLHPALRRLGQDVLDEGFDVDRAVARARAGGQERAVADVLLDQRVLAGVGNVWKAEALWAARLDPWAPVGSLDDERLGDVLRWTSEHMRAHVASGAPRRPSHVYGRAGRPCERCGERIRARLQGDDGRRTFWCPRCQPAVADGA